MIWCDIYLIDVSYKVTKKHILRRWQRKVLALEQVFKEKQTLFQTWQRINEQKKKKRKKEK